MSSANSKFLEIIFQPLVRLVILADYHEQVSRIAVASVAAHDASLSKIGREQAGGRLVIRVLEDDERLVVDELAGVSGADHVPSEFLELVGAVVRHARHPHAVPHGNGAVLARDLVGVNLGGTRHRRHATRDTRDHGVPGVGIADAVLDAADLLHRRGHLLLVARGVYVDAMQGAEDLRHVLGRGIGGETCHETVDARGHLLGTRPEEPAADRVGKRLLAHRRGIDGQRSELAFEPRQPRIVNLYIVRDVHVGELLDRGDDAAFMRIGKGVLDFAVPRAVDVDTRVDGNPEERERDVIGIADLILYSLSLPEYHLS